MNDGEKESSLPLLGNSARSQMAEGLRHSLQGGEGEGGGE